ncbi:MAG: nitrite/sulfite reductase [Gallionellaceae bacterium]
MSINASNLSNLEEIDLFEQAVQTFFDGHMDADRFTSARLQMGVYGQRQEGVNMLRVKVPGGRITPDQLDALADVTERYSQKGYANITTRQSIQIHYIPLAQTPEAMRRLARSGLTTREACNNTIRNMTACPLAGVCPREHVDIGTHLDGAMQHFLRNPLTQQMPRKFKISFSGCESDCAQALLHDAGVVAVSKDGQQGFMVKAGGGLGHKPHEAIVVEEFIPERELLFALEALVTLHNKYSDRTKRAKSRIKFLVDRFGADGFREKYREEFTRTREALANKPFPQGAWRKSSDVAAPGPGAPRTLFAQHQSGLSVLPLAVPLGELKVPQLRGIASLLHEQGLGEVHTTQDQNLVVTNVSSEKVAALRAGFAALGLREPAVGDNVVACPGTSTCRLGITASTIVAPKLSGGPRDLSIRVSGCHNGCAQPETGDIGIYGEGKRLHGKLVPHYQTYFGGNGLGGGKLALKGPSVPAARVTQAIERVQQAYADSGEQIFFDWAHKQESGYFKNLLADLAEVKEADAPAVMRDHGDESDFRVLQLGGGECAGASQVLIGANFFEAAHEREYRNALMFQRKYAEAAQCNESILRILGSGLAQLLGGIRQDEMGKIAVQLEQLGSDEITQEFGRLAGIFTRAQEMADETLSPLNRAVDAWTVKVATLCVALDEGLDLNEALPEGIAV